MSKRISKVKFNGLQIEIHTEERKPGQFSKESIYKSMETPSGDFKQAFDALIPVVYEILELPKEWKPGDVSVTGVSFSCSEGTEIEGAVASSAGPPAWTASKTLNRFWAIRSRRAMRPDRFGNQPGMAASCPERRKARKGPIGLNGCRARVKRIRSGQERVEALPIHLKARQRTNEEGEKNV